MRLLSLVLLAALPISAAACVSTDDTEDLGTVTDGKGDSTLIDYHVHLPASSGSSPGVKHYYVHSSRDFDVALAYDGAQATKIIVTAPDGTTSASDQAASPSITVKVSGSDLAMYKLEIDNYGPALTAELTAISHDSAVSPALLAAAKANLARVAKEIDGDHLASYGMSGALEDQFLRALSAEYEHQHPDQYAARVSALASMAFFALPEVLPPAEGKLTPFHGLDMDKFDTLASIEDQVFESLVQQNGGDTNGVRPFSVCETKFIIETYVRPGATYPGFPAYKSAYTAYAPSCTADDRAYWYNFRGLGGLRPSWVESNLADRFLRRMVKYCAGNPSSTWQSECAKWNADRLGYRQTRNRQLAARTMFYAAAQESYVIEPGNSLVFLEDRNGDNVGEFLRPGPITLKTGEQGTLQITSTSEFAGSLMFQPQTGAARTVAPQELNAESDVDPRWQGALLANGDMGLMNVFSDSTGCTGKTLDPAQCPLLRRFYSMIDRHENFYQTFSALTPSYYGISSQPSPLVASSITLAAAHQWDSAGTPTGGTAGFIYLMKIPFADILTGNDTSVATIMPGPKTTSIQSLYTGVSHLDMTKVWLDIASLSNNQYESEHEISAFGVVPAGEIEGILVIRKPAAVP
jgi:hypothetical protein